MSEAVTATGGASYQGAVKVADVGLRGMILLRGDFADQGVCKAACDVAGVEFPGVRDCLLYTSPSPRDA